MKHTLKFWLSLIGLFLLVTRSSTLYPCVLNLEYFVMRRGEPVEKKLAAADEDEE